MALHRLHTRHLNPLLAMVVLLLSVPAMAQERISIAVMEFTSQGGVTQDQMDALGEMLATELRDSGEYRVLGKSDIRLVLNVEESKQKLGACSDQKCLAELGGALGVRWVLAGGISLFGQTYLLNVKLIDAGSVEVVASVSRTIKGAQDDLLAEIPGAVRDLMAKAAVHIRPAAKEPIASPEAAKTDPKVPAAEEAAGQDEPAAAEESAWFARPLDRSGRWSVRGSFGFAHQFPVDVPENDPQLPGEVGLETWRTAQDGMQGAIAVEYGLWSWLSVYAQFGGAITTAQDSDYYWCDDLGSGACATDGAMWTRADSDRQRSTLEFAAGARFSYPLDWWIQPTAGLALGFSALTDHEPADVDVAAHQAYGLLVDLGVGADFFLRPRWTLGLMAKLMVRSYKDIQVKWSDTPYESSEHDLVVAGFSLVLMTGWIF